jgi:translocation and assembly module TamB
MAWQQKLRRIAIVIQASTILLAVAGYLVWRSPRFHEYLRAQIVKKVSEATGAEVQVQNFVFHLSRFTADAYGITVRGKEPVSARPLVQADQLRVRLKIVSLLRKKVDLNEIVLRHPVVNLQVRKDGTTNLPTIPKSNSSTNLFDLGIQHVLLEHGEVYYNDVRTPLDAELHDLQLEINAELVGKAYDGKLSYRDGSVLYGDRKPLPHDLTASFKATPSEFTLKPLRLTVASSTMELEGQVRNYSQPSATGNYRITIHPQDARSALKPGLTKASIPSGEVTLTGSVRYQQQDRVPLMRALTLDGILSGRELAVSTADLNAVVRNVGGQFRLANGNLDVHGFQADLLGGHITATATIQHIDANSIARVHASVQAISLSAANASLRTARLNQIPIDGEISGTADAAWAGGMNNVQARSEIFLKAAFTSAPAGSAPVPVEGMVHVSYDGRSRTATITNTSLSTPRTRVEVDGTAGRNLNLRLQAHAADLREVDALVLAFRGIGSEPSAGISGTSARVSPRSINFGGAADLELFVRGTMNDPRIRGQLAGRNLQLENSEWRSLELSLQASKSGISIENGSVVNARRGHINFAVGADLANWHYVPSSAINLELSSRDIAINELLQLAKLDYPVSGNLSADVSMHGSQLSPSGKGSVRLTQANVYGQPLQQLSIQSEGNGDALTSSLNVNLAAGSVKGKFVLYPKRRGYELQLDVPGINLGQLQAIQERNFGLAGLLTATANGRGTIDDPQLTLTAEIPHLQVRDGSISGIKTDIKVANHQAQLVLDSEVLQTSVQARATVNLSDGHYTRATVDTKGMPIEGLLALRAPAKSNGPRGIVEIHASAEGPLNDKNRMQAQVIIPTLKAEYQGFEIGNAQPIHIHYADSIIALDSAEISGTNTTLKLQGQLPLRGTAPATLSAIGTVDMQLVRFFQSDLQSSGKLQLDLRATGRAEHPNVKGQLRLENVSVIPADGPVGLQNLNGVLDVSNDQITITQLAGESGGGQISARGVIGYRPQLQMNVALQAKNVRLRYQDAIRTVVEGDLNLAGTRQTANLNGRILIDSLKFTQDFDLATLAGQVQSGPESAATQGLTNNIKLDIGVQTARDLNLTSSAVSLQGQANLRVIGTAADPVIVGRTQFTGGDIFLMNKRYQIERGVIEFSNPIRTEPVLNLRLTTTINQYNLSLTFLGPLDKMQTSYVSDPPLPTADIINLIARGQTSQQAATSTSELGASSLLAQGAASQLSGGIQKLAGLSSLSIDPTLGGNNSDPGARIAMQKRVTNNFLFTFATDVTSTQREIIQGEYQFNKRWSASVTRDENGGFAVDGKFHKRY